MRNKKNLGSFLNSRGLSGSGAEIGVYAGEFSLEILDQWHGQKLHLIDLWRHQSPKIYQDVSNLMQEKFDQLLEQIPAKLARHAGRYEILRATSHDAAATFADASLDFAYIDANHAYRFVEEDLRLWYHKVKGGGILAGGFYLDSVVGPTLYGVKTAVDEFAARHGHQVCVTLDKWPTWYFRKQDERLNPPRRIAMLTAYDQNQTEVASWSSPNKRAYCKRHGYDFIEETTDFPTDRAAYWAKIKFLQKHLSSYDWIFWTDADSLILRDDIRLEEFADENYDLVICHEDLGMGLYNINVGQMLFRNTQWSARFLQEVWDQKQFLNDKLPEQRAMIHLLWSRDLSDHVLTVTQRRFNSYPLNYRRGDFLIHLLDQPPAERIRLMRFYEQFAPCAGG